MKYIVLSFWSNTFGNDLNKTQHLKRLHLSERCVSFCLFSFHLLPCFQTTHLRALTLCVHCDAGAQVRQVGHKPLIPWSSWSVFGRQNKFYFSNLLGIHWRDNVGFLQRSERSTFRILVTSFALARVLLSHLWLLDQSPVWALLSGQENCWITWPKPQGLNLRDTGFLKAYRSAWMLECIAGCLCVAGCVWNYACL